MASQSLLAVPAKSTKSVDFQDKLPRFIEQNYEETPSSFLDDNAITTLCKEEHDLEASLPKAGAQAALLSGSSVSWNAELSKMFILVYMICAKFRLDTYLPTHYFLCGTCALIEQCCIMKLSNGGRKSLSYP